MTVQDPKLVALAPTLRGQIDAVTPYAVRGWAFDPARADEHVELVVTDHGEELGVVVADGFRDDLAREGLGDGRHAFEFWLPGRLSPSERHVVRVFRRSDGRELFYSPVILEPSEAFGDSMQARIRDLLRAPMTIRELDDRIAFFAALTDQLRDRRAEEAGATEPRRRAAAGGRPSYLRALVVDTTLPDTTRDAGSNAILSHVRALQRIGYETTFVPNDLAGAGSASAHALREESIAVALSPEIASVEELLRRQRDAFDLVYLHRVENAARYAALVSALQPSAQVIYGVADLHHLRLARQGEWAADEAIVRSAEIARLRELHQAWRASAVVTHSTVEARLLREALPEARVHVVPWDVAPDPIVRPFDLRGHVGFLGGFRHLPNVEAAQRLVTRIMPLVWRTHPHIKAVLIGSDLPDDLRRLAGRGIEVLGHAPDLFLVLNRLRLTVAPLSFGAGVKGKVLDSLARGLPCVMTRIAAEGLDLPPDFDRVIAEDDEGLARCIVEMHEHAEANANVAQAGLTFVETAWAKDDVDIALRKACTPSRRPTGDAEQDEFTPPPATEKIA